MLHLFVELITNRIGSSIRLVVRRPEALPLSSKAQSSAKKVSFLSFYLMQLQVILRVESLQVEPESDVVKARALSQSLDRPLEATGDRRFILPEVLRLGNAKISFYIFVLDTVLNSIRFSFFTLKMPRS